MFAKAFFTTKPTRMCTTFVFFVAGFVCFFYMLKNEEGRSPLVHVALGTVTSKTPSERTAAGSTCGALDGNATPELN